MRRKPSNRGATSVEAISRFEDTWIARQTQLGGTLSYGVDGKGEILLLYDQTQVSTVASREESEI